MNEKQFLARVPWGRLVARTRNEDAPRTALRFDVPALDVAYDVCPIDAAGGKWGGIGGNLGLDKTLHHAIVSAADIPLDRLEENYRRVVREKGETHYRPLAAVYAQNEEQFALAMRLRILFRARISEAKDVK